MYLLPILIEHGLVNYRYILLSFITQSHYFPKVFFWICILSIFTSYTYTTRGFKNFNLYFLLHVSNKKKMLFKIT